MSGRMKKQAVCLQMLIKTKNAKLRKAILEHADAELIRALCECAHNILRGNVQMTPREKTRLRKYQTKLRLIARKNLSVKQKRRHLQQTGGFLPALLAPLAASVVIPLLRQLFCVTKGTGDDEGTRGPAKGTGEGDLAINRDQRGSEGPAMAEINARTLMFNLGRGDAIDSTTSAKIARYAERKQLAYKLTDEGVLLLDGRGKKIHLRNGVVTLRNALGLHALPERIGDNRVLNKQQQHTNVVTMLHVRKMALVDPRLLKIVARKPDAATRRYRYGPARSRC